MIDHYLIILINSCSMGNSDFQLNMYALYAPSHSPSVLHYALLK